MMLRISAVFVVLIAVSASSACTEGGTGPKGSTQRDTVPPTVTFLTIPQPIVRDSDFQLIGQASDSGGVAAVTVDGSPVSLGTPDGHSRGFSVVLHSPANLWPLAITVDAADSAHNHQSTTLTFATRPQQWHAELGGFPAPDSVLQQVGLLVRVTGPAGVPTSVSTMIDGDSSTWRAIGAMVPPYGLTTALLREGAHTLQITASPDGHVHEFDTTVTVAVHLTTRSYQAVLLPPVPGGGDALGLDMNDSGVVVGWSTGPIPMDSGYLHAVRWVNGIPSPLPGSSTGSSANSINAQGDIAGVLRIDGTPTAAVWLGGDTLQTFLGAPLALRINSARQVLLGGHQTPPVVVASLYDVPTGASTPLWPSATVADLNELGQAVGYDYVDMDLPPPSPPSSPLAFGGVVVDSAPALLYPGYRASYHPADLNDRGETLLADYEEWVFSPGPSGSAQIVTPFLGLAGYDLRARMNNTGLAASIGLDGTIYLWDQAAGVARRVTTIDAGWKFDWISRISDSGVILAHGKNAITGAQGPLVLTPIP